MFKLKNKPFLVTAAQMVRDGEQITIQMYCDSTDELGQLVTAASAAIKLRKDEFQRELEESQRRIEAEAEAKKNKQGKK